MSTEHHPAELRPANGMAVLALPSLAQFETQLLLIVGPDFTVRFANDAFLAFFALSKHACEGKQLADLLLPANVKSILIALLTSAVQPLEPSQDIEVPLPIEGHLDLATAGVQVLSSCEVQAGLLVNIRLSCSKQQDAQISVATEKNDEAEQEQARTQLLRILAHDLREPLNGIINFTCLIRTRFGETLHQDAAKYLGYVEQSGVRLKALLDGLQSYVWLDGQVTRDEIVDLQLLVHELCEDLRFVIEQTGTSTHIEQLPTVRGNSSLLRLVFQNMLLNAIKFRQKEHALLITITAQRSDAGWVVRINDNGIGIPVAHKRRIFDLFFRGHPRAGYEGGGLGLAICHRIIKYHRGSIAVESQENMGSTFVIHLPG